MSRRMTACPNMLQEEAVVMVTSPVTHVAVVAVKSASIYGTGVPLAELTGRERRRLPIIIVTRKLRRIICVVDKENFLFFICLFPDFY